jgi:hypothetical protein
MSDMSQVIVAKSDQINAGDLVGISRTVKVAAVNVQPGTEQPVAVKIEGDNKVFRPCKSMSRVLVAAWGADSAKYAGRSMTLYCDPDVLWAGMKVGGIRISHMSHIDGPITLALAENKKNRKLFTVKPLQQRANTPAASLPDAAAVTPSTDAGQSTGAASNEDKEAATRDWARKTLALIDAAETREELDQLMAKRATGLEKVRGVLKTLADEIDAVAALKKSFLSGIVALDADAPGLDGDGYDPAAA